MVPGAGVRRLTDLRIGVRLALAFCLLLAGTLALVWLTVAQLARTDSSAQTLIAQRQADVGRVRAARAAAQDSAELVNSLLLLNPRARREWVLPRLVADIGRESQALGVLQTDARAPQTLRRLQQVQRQRMDCTQHLLRLMRVVERFGPVVAARQLNASGTPRALHAFLMGLSQLSAMESAQAARQLERLRRRQDAARRRILLFTAGALLLALAVAIGIARSITTPLAGVIEVAEQIAAGRLDGDLPAARGDEVGDLTRALVSMRAHIAQREADIRALAFVDPLTGIANRVAFANALDRALDALGERGRFALALLGLDRLREVNDSLGHAAGDIVLVTVGRRLQSFSAAAGCQAAHLESDEFALLMPGCGSAQRAMQMARALLEALQEPVVVQGQAIDVAASVGIVLAPLHGRERRLLLSHADLALQAAKRTRTGVQPFEPRMRPAPGRGLSLLSELRAALATDQFELAYQPKIDLGSGACTSAEALLRWRHPQRGRVSPQDIIPFAEQTGFIVRLTRWAIEQACAQSAAWQRAGLCLPVSVNLSARDIARAELPAFVAGQLERYALAPGQLCLEITESAVMEEVAQACLALEKLKGMGLRLSIDDYGTGYASLAYLRVLPVQEIKIDQSFVRGLATSREDATIVRSTVEMAHNLGLRVVAEGVESAATLAQLAQLGCDEAQGYYLSQPLGAAEFAGWCRQRRSPDASGIERAWPAERPDPAAADRVVA